MTYLKTLDFGWDAGCIKNLIGGTNDADLRKLDWQIELACRTIVAPIRVLAERKFKAAKIKLDAPPVAKLLFFLTPDPREEPSISAKVLSVEVGRDPRTLVEVQNDVSTAGEFALKIVEDGVRRLTRFPQFPVDLIHEICVEFRSSGYTTEISAGSKLIPGTRIKGEVRAVVNCISTERVFVASYRGQELARRKLSEMKIGDTHFSTMFNGFQRNELSLTVMGGSLAPPKFDFRIPPKVIINLAEISEISDLIMEKGW